MLRRAAGAATRSLSGVDKVGLALPAAGVASVAAVAEGAALGTYRYAGLHRAKEGRAAKAKAKNGQGPSAVTVVTDEARDRAVKAAVERAAVLADAQSYARDLVNLPPNRLFPQSFAESVKERAASASAKVSVKVLDEKALAKGGFGGIVGVGQGSANPPRIVQLSLVAGPCAGLDRPGRQGHHVRLRRPVHQARRRPCSP